MIFRQLFDAASSTYTYLLGDENTHEAVLIDPVYEWVQRDVALLRELGLQLLWVLETHVHADHVTGASALKALTSAKTAISEASGASGSDRLLQQGDKIAFGKHVLEAVATPGHTRGCMTFVLDSGTHAFTGDSLMIRSVGRTDFQQGSAEDMYHSIHQRIFSLPDACEIWPGHDYQGRASSTVGEEKRHNPRIATERSLQDFVGTMRNLNLPHPKQLAVAVPANLKMGLTDTALEKTVSPTWSPVQINYAGTWEVSPSWVEENGRDVQVVDVREPAEFEGELGHLAGALLLPLGKLLDNATQLDKQRPVVTVCRSGGRSGQAMVLLKRLGFEKVASMAGGMLRYRAERRP